MKLSELLQETSKYSKFDVHTSVFFANKIPVNVFVDAYNDKNDCSLEFSYDYVRDCYEFFR